MLKLILFLNENKIKRKYFAEQVLGIRDSLLCNALVDKAKLSPIYWRKIVEYTNGKVTYEDLVTHYETAFGTAEERIHNRNNRALSRSKTKKP